MFIWSVFFPLPRTKASILLDLIRFRPVSCSSFLREQNEVLSNTEDLIVLLFCSFDFEFPFFSQPLFPLPTRLALLLCLWKAASQCAARCTHTQEHIIGGTCLGHAVTALEPTGLGMLPVETEAQGRRARCTLWDEQLSSTTKSCRSGALPCRCSPADLYKSQIPHPSTMCKEENKID